MNSRICVFSDIDSASSAILLPLFHQYGLQPDLISSAMLDQSAFTDCSAVFVSAKWLERQKELPEFCSVLLTSDTPVCIYDISDTDDACFLLEQVKCSFPVGSVHGSSIEWSSSSFSGPLGGISSDFQSLSYCFTDTDDDWESLITIDGQGIFLRRRTGKTNLFLLSGASIDSAETSVTSEVAEIDLLTRLSPIILFLKDALGSCLWHTVKKMGCFIIDDPPLWNKYGFHSLQKLHDSLSRGGSASIAFIPWYYKTSTKDSVGIVQNSYPFLTICVHGLNHTANEFGIGSFSDALAMVSEAISRVEKHKKKHGLEYEPVIVFPQGKFSVAAVQALSYSSIIGAINTTLFSVDDSDYYHFTNLLSPFSVKYGFPILKRFYPDNILGKAFSSLLDRPMVYAEHHSFFRKGYDQFSSLFSVPGVKWVNPAAMFREYYQIQISPDSGMVEVRFFSKEFLFDNDEVSGLIHFQTAVMAETVKEILVNGRSLAYESNDSIIQFSAIYNPNEPLDIRIVGIDAPPFAKYTITRRKRLKTLLRRRASELRDNVLCKSELLEKMYSAIRRILKSS